MPRKPSLAAKKQAIIDALEDIKARDIIAIDVKRLTTVCDVVIIATAESARQTKALARNVHDKLKELHATIIGTEGEETGEWVLVDAGDIVIHIMQPLTRAHYNLEELWSQGRMERQASAVVPAAKAGARRITPPPEPGPKVITRSARAALKGEPQASPIATRKRAPAKTASRRRPITGTES